MSMDPTKSRKYVMKHRYTNIKTVRLNTSVYTVKLRPGTMRSTSGDIREKQW